MKKIKKILAIALVFAMILTSFSLISAVAAPLDLPGITTSSDFIDFENCTVLNSNGTALEAVDGVITMSGNSTGATYTIGNRLVITVTGEANKAEIVTDTVSNSKALKLTYTGSGSIDIKDYYADNHADISGVTVRTGTKVRFEKFADNASIPRFSCIRSTNGYGPANAKSTTAVPMSYFFSSFRAAVTNDPTVSTILKVNEARNNYADFSISYNPNTDMATLKNDNPVENRGYSKEYASDVIPGYTHYLIDVAGANKENNNGPDTDTTTSIIYFDDMYVETLKFDVKAVSIGGTFYGSSPLTNVPLNAPIDIRFNAPVAESAIDEAVSLKDSDNADVRYTVKKDSEDTISIYPINQTVNTTYTLTVNSGVLSSANSSIESLAGKTCTYTTCSDGIAFIQYIENENFNNIEDTTLVFTDSNLNPNTTPVKSFLSEELNGQIGIFRYNAGDSVSVVTDSVTNSKALKISRIAANNDASNTRITYVLPKTYNDGKIVTSADLRLVRNGNVDQFSSLMSYVSSTTSGSWNDKWYNKQDTSSGYYWSFVGKNDNWMNMSSHITDTTVFPMTQYLDFTKKEIGGQTFRNYATTPALQTKLKASAIADTDDVYGMNIVNINKTTAAAPTGGTDVYLDNFKVAYYGYKKLDVSDISIDAENVNTENDIVITMNDVVTPSDVTTENIVITKDSTSEKLTNYKVEPNKNVITIKFTQPPLDYNTDYTITISNLTTPTTTTRPMDESYVHSFKTNTRDAEKVIYQDNFEYFKTKYPGGNTFNTAQWKWVNVGDNVDVRRYNAEDKVEWAYDEVAGKWGFKITQNSKEPNDQINLFYKFPEAYSKGRYLVKVDSRIQNHSTAISQWPGIVASSGLEGYAALDQLVVFSNGLLLVSNAGTGGVQTPLYFTKDEPHHTMMVAFESGKNADFGMDGELYTSTKAAGVLSDLAGLRFSLYGGNANNGTQFTGDDNDGTDKNPGVYWIYGITVEKIFFDIIGSSVEGRNDFDPEIEELSVNFTDNIDPKTVTTENVLVYQGDTQLTAKEYSVELNKSGKKIVIDVPKMQYETNYKVVVTKNIMPVSTKVGQLEEGAEYSFTTATKDFDTINEEFTVNEGTVTCKGVFKNNTDATQDFDYYVALYSTDEDGNTRLISVEKANVGSVSGKDNANIDVTFTNVTATNLYAIGFAWSGLKSLDYITIFD